MPDEKVEIKCPYCGTKGMTRMRPSFTTIAVCPSCKKEFTPRETIEAPPAPDDDLIPMNKLFQNLKQKFNRNPRAWIAAGVVLVVLAAVDGGKTWRPIPGATGRVQRSGAMLCMNLAYWDAMIQASDDLHRGGEGADMGMDGLFGPGRVHFVKPGMRVRIVESSFSSLLVQTLDPEDDGQFYRGWVKKQTIGER